MTANNTTLDRVNDKQSQITKDAIDDRTNRNKVVRNNLAKHAIQVHKFGGSSLATAECIKRAINIIKENCQLDDIVVVSANGKTTDSLFSLYSLFINNTVNENAKINAEVDVAICNIALAQEKLIGELLNSNNSNQLLLLLHKDIEQIRSWLGINITQHHNDILAFGEVWSARLLSALLNEMVCPSNSIDARDFLIIDNEQNCVVDTAISAVQLRKRRQFGKLAVITGYISKDSFGHNCTLGRNGSDYSATIIASLVAASNVTLWTDVDGIYSADPRVVPSARKLNRLPNGVAKELGRLGNPVLHAKTLLPLVNLDNQHHTHLQVASSFDASVAGTEIGKFGHIAKQELSVTFLNDLLLAHSVSFKGESGVRAKAEFSPIGIDDKQGFMLITQAQQKPLSQWLASHDVEVTFKPVAIIATVGHCVAERGDIKAKFKRSLKSVNPMDFVISDNNHSIIAILPEPCSIELLNTVHHKITKDSRNIGLVVAGMGNIGQRFLELLPAQLNKVYALENLHLVGLLSSKKALINNDGIDVERANFLFDEKSTNYDHTQLLKWLSHHPYDDLVVVDITPSEEFSLLYEQLFTLGIHIIGANKWAASSDSKSYNNLVNIADSHNSLWLGNTTVGAGLPINYAIDDLRQSGDSIHQLSGIFSGTLSWLFETFDGTSSFSELLLDALKRGITEPDPREDLSGRDVQRKLLILARKAGFELSLEDINCQNLVPSNLQDLSLRDFLDRANELDEYFTHALTKASKEKACIRYVARFINDEKNGVSARVELENLPLTDAFANLTPGDNIFQIVSQWYQDNPLIIRGAGAGRDVTAGGLHSDLVNICKQLAHKQNQVKIKGIH